MERQPPRRPRTRPGPGRRGPGPCPGRPPGHGPAAGRRRIALLPALLLLAATAGCDWISRTLFSRTAAGGREAGLSVDEVRGDALREVIGGLDTPWEIRFLPDGDLLVTERPGRLLRIDPGAHGGGGGPAEILERHPVEGVREAGEGGLMGLAVHPGYPDSPWIYLCLTAAGDGGLVNRVVRYRYADGRLSGATTVVDDMAGAAIHDGCRLEFGPDGHLFVTMGDAGRGSRAQDRDALNGKVLRLTDGGGVPDDNPFGTPVWSWGHRNPQGLAFDDRGRLWSTEHGPSGLGSGLDELNLIRRGGNYGWPDVTGDRTREGTVAPVLHSGSATWAPAGLAHLGGRLFFGGLRGEALHEVRGAADASSPGPDGPPRLIRHFHRELGRIRAVRAGPGGALWFGTSNRDGRGRPREDDDRIFRLEPGSPAGR